MSRRKARVLAFQALFSFEAGGQPLEALLKFDWEAPKASLDEDMLGFSRNLTAGTIENLELIDSKIKEKLKSWDFSRLKRVDLAILRISAYSLLFQKDIPAGVVIEEAIAISRDYGEDGSFKFINGILDSIRKDSAETA